MLRRILKRNDDDHRQKNVNCSWFVGIEKRAVLTEVIMRFGDPHMNLRKCLQVMKKLLYLLNQGQAFTKSEAATVLVSANKLFRLEHTHLIRLVYLVVKELGPIVEEVVILYETSLIPEAYLSRLFRINNRRNITLRPNAIRLLSRFANASSSLQTEYHLKEAIMDKDRNVSSAGLVCALLLLKKDPGIAIKVCEQVGKVAATSYGIRKYRALCLLFLMQQIEIIGVRELARPHIDKIFSNLKYINKRSFPWPFITCLMLRFIAQINRASSDASGEPYPDYCKYIKSCIFDSSHVSFEGGVMVAIEGLRSMKKLRNVSSSEVDAAKEAVRMQINWYKDTVFWFGGMRAMHELQIQSHLKANDVAQVVKPKTTEAPATHNLRRRVL